MCSFIASVRGGGGGEFFKNVKTSFGGKTSRGGKLKNMKREELLLVVRVRGGGGGGGGLNVSNMYKPLLRGKHQEGRYCRNSHC